MPAADGRIRIYFAIYGIAASEITHRLGIAPRSVLEKGAQLRSGRAASDMWEISEAADDDLQIVMDRLLARLRSRWDDVVALAASAKRVEMEVAIYRTDDERDEALNLNLEPDTLASLGQLRPSIQFSIY